jgi:hypothetical protein
MSGTKAKATSAAQDAPPSFEEIMRKAGASAVRGGTAGAVAMGANVACLMWMRTTVSIRMTAACILLFHSLIHGLIHFISLIFLCRSTTNIVLEQHFPMRSGHSTLMAVFLAFIAVSCQP